MDEYDFNVVRPEVNLKILEVEFDRVKKVGDDYIFIKNDQMIGKMIGKYLKPKTRSTLNSLADWDIKDAIRRR